MTRWGKQVSPDKPVLPEYPRPQLVRQQWLNLNGLWDYAITAKESPAPSGYQGKILVPFPIESVLSQVNKRIDENSRLWYRRTLAIPAAWAGQRVLLHFGAVDWETVVAVNGNDPRHASRRIRRFQLRHHRRAGAQRAARAAAFRSGTRPTAANPTASKPGIPEGIFYTPVTGIWQTVWLEPVATAHIEQLQLVPDVDRGRLLLTAMAAGAEKSAPVEAVVTSRRPRDGAGGRQSRANRSPSPYPMRSSGGPTSPFLYDLTVALTAGR